MLNRFLDISTDVSSGGYVNIYWHDSQQQQEGGNCYILPFREPSSSLLERAVDENRKGLQFVFDLMCFCSLGSCFVADVICVAVEGFISSCRDFPMRTPLKPGAVVEENGGSRSPGICLYRNEQYNGHPGFAGGLRGPAVLVSDNSDMCCISDTKPAEAPRKSIDSYS